jgi:hypothetical protein
MGNEESVKKAKEMLIEINKFKDFCKSMGYNLDESRMIQECLSVEE